MQGERFFLYFRAFSQKYILTISKKVLTNALIECIIIPVIKSEAKHRNNTGKESKMKEVEYYILNKPMGITTVDDENRIFVSFNNAKKEIWYNAQTFCDGKLSGGWVDYMEKGVVSGIEERLGSLHNPIRFMYADLVTNNSDKHDPDGELWSRIVEYVKAHESEIFTKTGDFRKGLYNSEVSDFIDSLASDVVEPDTRTIEGINYQAKLADMFLEEAE